MSNKLSDDTLREILGDEGANKLLDQDKRAGKAYSHMEEKTSHMQEIRKMVRTTHSGNHFDKLTGEVDLIALDKEEAS